MTLKQRLLSLVACTALLGLSTSHAAEFKGWAETQRVIARRLIRDESQFFLFRYLGENGYESFGDSLRDLLGTYRTNFSEISTRFRNGTPNALNLMLWHVVFSGLAKDMATVCDPVVTPPPGITLFRDDLAPEVLSIVEKLCAWPADSARNEEALFDFWVTLMAFDAPFEEYVAWRDFFLGPDYETAAAKDAIFGMTLALTNNPHFLLRK